MASRQNEFFEDVSESEELAKRADPNTNVFLIPAFVGLGAPHWVPDARGAIFGLTRDSGREELSLATHEAVAFQTKEIISSLKNDGVKVDSVRIDGGLTRNVFLIRFYPASLNWKFCVPKRLNLLL